MRHNITKAARQPYAILSNTQKAFSPSGEVEGGLCPCHLSLLNLIFNGLLFLIPLGSIIFNKCQKWVSCKWVSECLMATHSLLSCTSRTSPSQWCDLPGSGWWHAKQPVESIQTHLWTAASWAPLATYGNTHYKTRIWHYLFPIGYEFQNIGHFLLQFLFINHFIWCWFHELDDICLQVLTMIFLFHLLTYSITHFWHLHFQ